MTTEVIDVSGLPEPVIGRIRELVVSLRNQFSSTPTAGPRTGVLDFLDALPPGRRSPESWQEFEREFQAERDSWER